MKPHIKEAQLCYGGTYSFGQHKLYAHYFPMSKKESLNFGYTAKLSRRLQVFSELKGQPFSFSETSFVSNHTWPVRVSGWCFWKACLPGRSAQQERQSAFTSILYSKSSLASLLRKWISQSLRNQPSSEWVCLSDRCEYLISKYILINHITFSRFKGASKKGAQGITRYRLSASSKLTANVSV